MASRDYLPLCEVARKQCVSLSQRQQTEIAAMYLEVAQDFERRYAKENPNSLTYRWLQNYAKSLRKDSKALFSKQKDLITGNIVRSAKAVTQAQQEYFMRLAPRLSERFTDVFSKASQKAVNELVSGEIYHNFKGLSDRLWNYQGKFNRDIGYIINQGIIAKKPAYDLAKDLDLFLNPQAKKPWDWRKVYPNCAKTVDYNSQRLARTSVSHAYQLSLERSTADNPYVEGYQWLSSNSHSRMCAQCSRRNGKHYKKGNIPLDHPNGMCTIIPVVKKSYNEMAMALSDWANGGENSALDNWLLKDFTSPTRKYSQTIRKSAVEYKAAKGLNLLFEPTVKPDVYKVCDLDPNIYQCVTKDITSCEVVLTQERVEHIQAHHPGDFEAYSAYMADAITAPDYILKSKQADTAIVLKSVEQDSGVKLILRIHTSKDKPNYKNSVLTYQKVQTERFNRYVKNGKIIYKRE